MLLNAGLAASVCSVAIVERCLLGTDHTPLRALVAPSDALARQVSNILQRALEEAVRDLRLRSVLPAGALASTLRAALQEQIENLEREKCVLL